HMDLCIAFHGYSLAKFIFYSPLCCTRLLNPATLVARPRHNLIVAGPKGDGRWRQPVCTAWPQPGQNCASDRPRRSYYLKRAPVRVPVKSVPTPAGKRRTKNGTQPRLYLSLPACALCAPKTNVARQANP